MTLIELPRTARVAGGQSESDDDGECRPVSRIRLTEEESRRIRYVFADWSADAGVEAVSLHDTMAENTRADDEGPYATKFRPRKAAGNKTRSPEEQAALAKWMRERRWAREDRSLESWHQQMTIKSAGGSVNVGALEPTEHWTDKSTADERFGKAGPDGILSGPGECALILRAWRALKSMGEARSMSLIILFAMYGDLPPGLPSSELWTGSDVLHEPVESDAWYHRRVCRYAASAQGGGLALECLVPVERRERPGETREEYKRRIDVELSQRAILLQRVGEECELLIARACGDYREAWRAAS